MLKGIRPLFLTDRGASFTCIEQVIGVNVSENNDYNLYSQ